MDTPTLRKPRSYYTLDIYSIYLDVMQKDIQALTTLTSYIRIKLSKKRVVERQLSRKWR